MTRKMCGELVFDYKMRFRPLIVLIFTLCSGSNFDVMHHARSQQWHTDSPEVSKSPCPTRQRQSPARSQACCTLNHEGTARLSSEFCSSCFHVMRLSGGEESVINRDRRQLRKKKRMYWNSVRNKGRNQIFAFNQTLPSNGNLTTNLNFLNMMTNSSPGVKSEVSPCLNA